MEVVEKGSEGRERRGKRMQQKCVMEEEKEAMEEGAGIRKEGGDEECDKVSDGRRHQKKLVEEKQNVMVQVTEEDGRGKKAERMEKVVG